MGNICSENSKESSVKNRRKSISTRGNSRIENNNYIKIQKKYKYEFTNLKEKYEINHLVKEKAHSKTFKIKDKLTRVTRLLKEVKKENVVSCNTHLQEFEILQSLDYPNIVKVFEFYENENNYYFVYEDLSEAFQIEQFLNNNQLNEEQICMILYQMISTLNYLSKNQIDLSDFNIGSIVFQKTDLDRFYQIKLQNIKNYTNFSITTQEKGAYYEITNTIKIGLLLYILITGKFPMKNEIDMIEDNLNSLVDVDCSVWKTKSRECKNFLLKTFKLQEDIKLENFLSDPWFKKFNVENNIRYVQRKSITKLLNNIEKFKNLSKFQQFCISYIVKNTPQSKEILELTKIFRSIDTKNKGRLEKKEFIDGLTKLYSESRKAEVNDDIKKNLDEIFKKLDTHKGHEISLNEFITTTITKEMILVDNNIRVIFQYFDQDRSNTISLKELKKGIEKGLNHKIKIENLNKILPIENNCEIDYLEFKKTLIRDI